jgi:hypothetical protein
LESRSASKRWNSEEICLTTVTATAYIDQGKTTLGEQSPEAIQLLGDRFRHYPLTQINLASAKKTVYADSEFLLPIPFRESTR